MFDLIPPVFRSVMSVIWANCGVFAALVNTLCITILWRQSQRSISNRILTSLSISDCLVGYICFPLGSWLLFSKSNNCFALRVLLFMNLWMLGISASAILFIGYDRYIHSTKLSNYNLFMTRRKVNAITICYLVVMFGFALGSVLNYHVYLFSGFLLSIIYTILMIVCYIKTWKALSGSQRRLDAMKSSNQAGNSTTSTEDRIKAKRKKNLAKKVLILMITYVVTIFPCCIWAIILRINNNGQFNSVEMSTTFVIILFIALGSSCVNPIIYISCDCQFRKAMKTKLLFCKK